MLYTETDKGDLGQKRLSSRAIQCPKRSKTAFVVRENHLTPNLICWSYFTRFYLNPKNIIKVKSTNSKVHKADFP